MNFSMPPYVYMLTYIHTLVHRNIYISIPCFYIYMNVYVLCIHTHTIYNIGVNLQYIYIYIYIYIYVCIYMLTYICELGI